MDKAEEAKKEISQLRTKRQNAIDDARITYLEGFIAGSEYAQQISREVAVDFMIEMDDGLPKEDWYKIFDDWRRKQKQ